MEQQTQQPEVDQQRVKDIVNNAANFIHNPESRDKVLQQLKSIKNPVEALGKMAFIIMMELEKQAEEQGVKLGDMEKLNALPHVVSLILEIGFAAKILPDLGEREVQAAMAYAVQMFVKYLSATGKIDANQLNQQMQEQVSKLPEERKVEFVKNMKDLNDTAVGSVSKYNSTPPKSLLGGTTNG